MIINISMAIYNINNHIIMSLSIISQSSLSMSLSSSLFLCSIPCYFNNTIFALCNYTLKCINLDYMIMIQHFSYHLFLYITYKNDAGHFQTKQDAREAMRVVFFCTRKTYLYAQNEISYEYIQISF